MAVETVASFLSEVRHAQLLEPSQLEEMTREARGYGDSRVFAKHCLKKGWLTPFQISQVLHGGGANLAMGQYRILEKLGEGGMGQVFKARHQAMGRIVALKVIRKDRLGNEKAVKRFVREIQVVAKLSHPNVVLAFDADAVGGTHFIAMEYVDGIDLSKLVKDKGPLPVAQACDFVRQAALGLQHAHERGLVHRDIKPSNLLVAKPPSGDQRSASNSGVLRGGSKHQIKILDMGLARLMFDSDEASTGMTMDGSVVGTPDFMSPEQGKNSHLVDHRADLYSLGCTFYYLLSGQVPFPGGSNIDKLVKHQVDQAKPIEQLRPDVPDGVRQVLKRLMMKKPDDRPQTGNDVAGLLAPFCDPSAAKPGGGRDSKKMKLPTAEMIAVTPRAKAWSTIRGTADSSIAVFRNLFGNEPRRPGRRRRRRRKLVLLTALVAPLLLIGLWLWSSGLFSGSSTEPTTSTNVASTSTAKLPPLTGSVPIVTGDPRRAARFIPDSANFVVGINVREVTGSGFSGFAQRELNLRRGDAEFKLGIDLNSEVQHILICLAIPDGNGRQQRAIVLHGDFENSRFQTAMARSGQPAGQGTYHYLPDDRAFVAMFDGRVLVWTQYEPLLRGLLERPAGVSDAVLQRRFENWDSWSGIRALAGASYPTGEAAPTDTLAGIGLRELMLDVTFNRQVGSARLSAVAANAAVAARLTEIVPQWLAELANQDNGFSLMFKALLDSTPMMQADHTAIWQLSLTAADASAYFRKN
jgi:serine/threonine-protein kinase